VKKSSPVRGGNGAPYSARAAVTTGPLPPKKKNTPGKKEGKRKSPWPAGSTGKGNTLENAKKKPGSQKKERGTVSQRASANQGSESVSWRKKKREACVKTKKLAKKNKQEASLGANKRREKGA